MKRSHLLALLCLLIAAAAIGLRIRGGLQSRDALLVTTSSPATDRQDAGPTTGRQDAGPTTHRRDAGATQHAASQRAGATNDAATRDAGATPDAATQPAGATQPVPRDFVAHPSVAEGEQANGPRRIISLAPSITEVICALGLRDRLVGRTQYCVYPPGLESVPSVGALMDTNYEFIKSLQPDVVFVTANSGDMIGRLSALHLHGEPVPHNSVEDIYAAIRRVGEVCGRPRTADALIRAIQADVSNLQQQVAVAHRPSRRVLVMLGELPVPPSAIFVAGPGSFLDGLLQMAGGTNAARDALHSSHGEIPLEKLIQIDPELILEFRDRPAPGAIEDMYRSWSAVGELRAIRDRHVRTVGGLEWLSAGPRIALELQRFIAAMDAGQ
jgi:iron complex transport system substrate-binding protein